MSFHVCVLDFFLTPGKGKFTLCVGVKAEAYGLNDMAAPVVIPLHAPLTVGWCGSKQYVRWVKPLPPHFPSIDVPSQLELISDYGEEMP